eukprot:gene150-biopygen7565
MPQKKGPVRSARHCKAASAPARPAGSRRPSQGLWVAAGERKDKTVIGVIVSVLCAALAAPRACLAVAGAAAVGGVPGMPLPSGPPTEGVGAIRVFCRGGECGVVGGCGWGWRSAGCNR